MPPPLTGRAQLNFRFRCYRTPGYGSPPRLSQDQQDKFRAYITRTLPRTMREVDALIEAEFGIVF